MRQPIEIADFAAIFETFRLSAFRLETRAAYLVDEESEELLRFLNGESLPLIRNASWCQLVQRCASRGGRFERVHIIPRALTPYLRFEIEWGYVFSQEAGECVRLLYVDDENLPTPVRSLGDFWLFDEAILVLMDYDGQGQFSGAIRETDEAIIREYADLAKRLIYGSFSLKQFLAAQRSA